MSKNNELYNFYKELDRSLFVDKEQKAFAMMDSPLPIGYGQTVSQPSLVYKMVEYLDLQPDSKVLEIGTGSGYQTAFLAEFSGMVYTVEKIEELSEKAKKRLGSLGYDNISFKIGDGSEGWSKYSPYDRIIVSCAASSIPDPLTEQLSKNGKMVIPVGDSTRQDLVLVKKDEHGKVFHKKIFPVIFVEFKGRYGWQ